MKISSKVKRGIVVTHLSAAAVACSIAVHSNAFAASGSASFTVTVRVLLRKKEQMVQADVKIRRQDGTIEVLTSEQKAQFATDPASVLRLVEPDAGGYVRLLVDM